jgi:hypothetical protein
MRNFLYSIQRTDVVQGINTGRKTTVEAEDLVFDEGGQRKEVEKVGEVFPDVCVAVLAQALVVEAVYLGNLAGFVVATEDGYALWVADFEGNEEGDGLDGEVATIDVVAF